MSRYLDRSDELPAPDPAPPRKPRGVTVRAVVLALLLFPLNAYWIIITEAARYQGHPTTISLFYNVVFILLVLCLLNLPLRRFAPRIAFSPGELATVYVLLCIGSVAAAHDAIQVLAPVMTYVYYYASPENGWSELIQPHMPDWLTMQDEVSLRNMHWGDTNFMDPVNFAPWLGPVAWWTAFTIVLWVVCLALSSIFQRRWIHSERLTYPIIMLPLEMVAERSRAMPEGFFRNRMMWVAFGVAFGLDILNGLNKLHPTWPSLSVSPRANPNLNLVTQLADRPWNAIGYAPVSFYPFVIGLGLLLPVELAQSCVLFFWFWKAELVAGAWLGQNVTVGFPWIEEQEFGGYSAITAFFLWASSGHLKRVWHDILHPPPRGEREGEGMAHRTAAIVIAVGTVFLVWFSCRAGMPVWMAIAFFLIYYVVSLAIGRVRAEMGMPAHDMHFAGPDQMLIGVLGSRRFPPKALAIDSMYWWFNRAYRNHILPHQAEAYKLAERTGTDRRWMTAAMTIAICVAMPVAFWAMLQASYSYGINAEMRAGRGFGWEPMSKLATWLNTPTDPSRQRGLSILVGFAFLFSMMLLKTRVSWWPIHPVGYAVSASWSMQFLWCPLLLASTAKLLITRYGGHRAIQSVVPFAFGLILGDLSGGSFWTLYSLVKKVDVYSIWQ